MQYGIIAALITMEMATAESIDTLSDHATEMAVQSNITQS